MTSQLPDPTQSPAFQQLRQEIKAYEGMKDDLLKWCKGKHVIIKDGEFIGAFDTFHNAAAEATRRFGRGPYLIRQVVEQERVHRMPSSAYRPLPDERLKKALFEQPFGKVYPSELARLQALKERMEDAGMIQSSEYNLPLTDTIGYNLGSIGSKSRNEI